MDTASEREQQQRIRADVFTPGVNDPELTERLRRQLEEARHFMLTRKADHP